MTFNTTADWRDFPSDSQWRIDSLNDVVSMEYLVLNWFIQMKYLLAQIKIIMISSSLTK